MTLVDSLVRHPPTADMEKEALRAAWGEASFAERPNRYLTAVIAAKNHYLKLKGNIVVGVDNPTIDLLIPTHPRASIEKIRADLKTAQNMATSQIMDNLFLHYWFLTHHEDILAYYNLYYLDLYGSGNKSELIAGLFNLDTHSGGVHLVAKLVDTDKQDTYAKPSEANGILICDLPDSSRRVVDPIDQMIDFQRRLSEDPKFRVNIEPASASIFLAKIQKDIGLHRAIRTI